MLALMLQGTGILYGKYRLLLSCQWSTSLIRNELSAFQIANTTNNLTTLNMNRAFISTAKDNSTERTTADGEDEGGNSSFATLTAEKVQLGMTIRLRNSYYEVLSSKQKGRDGRSGRGILFSCLDLLLHRIVPFRLTARKKIKVVCPTCYSGIIAGIDTEKKTISVYLLPSSPVPFGCDNCMLTIPIAMAFGAVEFLHQDMRIDVYEDSGHFIRIGLPSKVLHLMKAKFKDKRTSSGVEEANDGRVMRGRRTLAGARHHYDTYLEGEVDEPY